MVKSCAAYGCSNRFIKGSAIHFHKFPIENPELCKSWIIALKRDKFKASKHSFLCSKHFLPSDYVTSIADEKPHLKPAAVPSLFNFPDRLNKIIKPRKPPTKRKLENYEHDNPSSSAAAVSPPPSKKSSVNQLASSPSPAPSSSKKNVPSPTKLKLRRKIKTLKQKLRRRENKINSMEDLL